MFLNINKPQTGVCGNGICEPGDMLECPGDCNCVYFTAAQEIPTGGYEINAICAPVVWNQDYDTARRLAGVPDEFLFETEKYDYGSYEVQDVVQRIKFEGITSSYDAIEWVAKYVDYNIKYDIHQNLCQYGGSNELCSIEYSCADDDEKCIYNFVDEYYRCVMRSGDVCEKDSASKVLMRGCGWCSTQSYAVIAILRGIGISAKQVRGCVYWDPSCLATDGEPLLRKGDIEIMPDGRVIVGSSGGPHSWVMAWSDDLPDGEQGWVLIEATSGRIKPSSCLQYQWYSETSTGEDMCYITRLESYECNDFCEGCIYG